MIVHRSKITDIDIIQELKKNSRISYNKIAEKFSVTEATVRKRVKKMINKGVIRKFTIDVDPRKIGYKIEAMIGFDIKEEHYTSTLLELKNLPEVISLSTSTGDHMVMIEAWFHDLEELNEFEQKLSKHPGIFNICPAIIVEKLK